MNTWIACYRGYTFVPDRFCVNIMFQDIAKPSQVVFRDIAYMKFFTFSLKINDT